RRDRGGDLQRGSRSAVGRADAAVLAAHSTDGEHHVGAVSRRLPAVPMIKRRLRWTAAAIALLAAAAYLREPPGTARQASGLFGWEEDPPGTRFRWTNGRATFFVPSSAAVMTLPLRGVFPGDGGKPVTVDVKVDDRWLATIQLADPQIWV